MNLTRQRAGGRLSKDGSRNPEPLSREVLEDTRTTLTGSWHAKDLDIRTSQSSNADIEL